MESLSGERRRDLRGYKKTGNPKATGILILIDIVITVF